MNIKLIGHTPDEDLIFTQNNPWKKFYDEFIKNNFRVVTGNVKSNNFEYLVVNAHSPKSLKKAKNLKLDKSRLIMIYWEPSVTAPNLHSYKIRSQYGIVYTPSKLWTKNLTGEYFSWPQGKINRKVESFKVWNQRQNKAFIIASNKFSAVKGQNYTLRRSTNLLRDYDGQSMVDIYGSNWNRGFHYNLFQYLRQLNRTPLKNLDKKSWHNLARIQKNYYGAPSNKQIVGSRYKINLVIENSAEYVSEKLFEAHGTQNIVVYVGADLKSEGINPKIAIQCEGQISKLRKTLNELACLSPKQQYSIMCEQNKVAQKEAINRDSQVVLKNLAKSIISKINEK